MRPIHMVMLDKRRPALILTREIVRPKISGITVAPITSAIRGLSTEVRVGRANGLDHDSVVSCDTVVTVYTGDIGRHVGYLLPSQERDLTVAIMAAYDLEDL